MGRGEFWKFGLLVVVVVVAMVLLAVTEAAAAVEAEEGTTAVAAVAGVLFASVRTGCEGGDVKEEDGEEIKKEKTFGGWGVSDSGGGWVREKLYI